MVHDDARLPRPFRRTTHRGCFTRRIHAVLHAAAGSPASTGYAFQADPDGGRRQVQTRPSARLTEISFALCHRMFFEDVSLGYGFVMLPQIEPDFIGVRVTCGDATAVCRNQTRLVADTNAGMIALTVRVQP